MNYWILGGLAMLALALGWVYWAIREWEKSGGL
jgi:hypothetical protein